VLDYPNVELTFILTTDASKMAVAVIISQVNNELVKPIAYVIRQLNKTEECCAASEIEMLALVWETKYFLCYLYGKMFLVRTEQSAFNLLSQLR